MYDGICTQWGNAFVTNFMPLSRCQFGIHWRKILFTKEFQVHTVDLPIDKMFSLFRKPQVVTSLVNGLKVANRPSVAGLCSEETPRRIEKSKSKQRHRFEVRILMLILFCFYFTQP